MVSHMVYHIIGMPYLYRSFSAKEPYNWWLICSAERYCGHRTVSHMVNHTKGMPYLCRSFSAKEPYNCCLFCRKCPTRDRAIRSLCVTTSKGIAFRKRANNYRALLQKVTHKEMASYASIQYQRALV